MVTYRVRRVLPYLRGMLAAVIWAAGLPCAVAATLQISPVTIELGSSERGAAMTLMNPGDTPIHGQLRVYRWDQDQGEDTLESTEDLAASPPLIQIPPGGEQLVRIVRTGETSGAGEQSFRILIDEIAEDHDLQGSGVRIQMRYSVPVFVTGSGGRGSDADLQWSLIRGPQHWQLRVDNSGPSRARINTVSITTAQGQRHVVQSGLLGYALAGRYRVWDLDMAAGTDLGPRPVIEASVNARPVRVEPVAQRGNE